MKKRIWIGLAVAIALVISVAMVTSQGEREVGQLMKAKTGYAHRLLDAVVVEDFDVMRDQAFRLKAVAETADWRSSELPGLVRETEAFIRATDRLHRAASDEDGDAAALAYMDVTLRCVHCHRHLRGLE